MVELQATIDAVEKSEINTHVKLSSRFPLQVRVSILSLHVRVLPCTSGCIIIRSSGRTEPREALVWIDAILVTRYTIAHTEFQVVEPRVRALHEFLIDNAPCHRNRWEGAPFVVCTETRATIATDSGSNHILVHQTIVHTSIE